MTLMIRVSRRTSFSSLLTLSLLTWGLLQSPMSSADSRFHDHRARAAQGNATVVVVQGRIVGSRGDDRLLTSIATPRLTAKGIGDLDNVWVHVGGHKMLARVMSDATFRTITSDQDSMSQLDVDIICLLGDARGQPGMEIVGLGGGLVPWIKPKGTMHVTVEKVQY